MKRINRIVALLLLVLIVPFFAPASAHAYDGVFLQVTIAHSPWRYIGVTVNDSALFESNMMESKLNSRAMMSQNSDLDDDQFRDDMVLTWAEMKGGLTAQDSKRAALAKTILIPSLNEALRFMNGGMDYPDRLAFREASNSLKTPTGGYDGYTFKVGNTTGRDPFLSMQGLSDENYMTITSPGGESMVFVYSMPKYIESDDPAGSNRDGSVSWKHLIDSAQIYEAKGIVASNAGSAHDQSTFGKALSGLISALVTGLETILGLESVNDLVFNLGARSNEDLYVFGVFPTSWNPYIHLLFLVFQVVAWATVLITIINMVFRKSLSTISKVRAEVMLEIQQLIFAGLLLVAIFPAFRILFNGSFLITDVFANVMDPVARDEFFVNLPLYGSSLAGVLVGIAYLVITIYFNVFYLVRGILIALFIAASPLFVIFITLGKGPKMIFNAWFKNVLAGVIIQPIHAFVLSFLMLLPYGASGIQAVVFCATLIPISETIRNVIVGNAGGKMDAMGDNMTHWGIGGIATVAGLAMKGGRKAESIQQGYARKEDIKTSAQLRSIDLQSEKAKYGAHVAETQSEATKASERLSMAKANEASVIESGGSSSARATAASARQEAQTAWDNSNKKHLEAVSAKEKFDEGYKLRSSGIERDLKRSRHLQDKTIGRFTQSHPYYQRGNESANVSSSKGKEQRPFDSEPFSRPFPQNR